MMKQTTCYSCDKPIEPEWLPEGEFIVCDECSSDTDKLSVEKLQEQLNTAKYFFKNILDVDPNLNKGHVSHLENCVRVMKNSAEKALAAIEKGENNEI
ncbi:hypothetical protein KGN15_002330 [Lactococcus lactis]|uniref:hypothetical protein n=1 Tax=Lactococcus lactis TaxID=1358 RepID=UPI001C1F4314|nr:hypothetical protein [Lactococcus lactis]MBU7533002.1 hypothetical protein [Lactococcus lactis]